MKKTKITIKDLETNIQVEYLADEYVVLVNEEDRTAKMVDATVLSLKKFIQVMEENILEVTEKEDKKQAKVIDMFDFLTSRGLKEEDYFVGFNLAENDGLKNYDVAVCFIPKKEMIKNVGEDFYLLEKILDNANKKEERFVGYVETAKDINIAILKMPELEGIIKFAFFRFRKDKISLFNDIVDDVAKKGYFVELSEVPKILGRLSSFARKKDLIRLLEEE